MKIDVEVQVDAPKEKIWEAITDIEGSEQRISGIEKVEVLEKPESGFVGTKWKETRTMFGKEATEVMWVTDSVENSHYNVRAESHGVVYNTVMSIENHGGNNYLKWEFGGEPQTVGAKIASALMGFMVKSSTRKALQKDLEDIKKAVEAK